MTGPPASAHTTMYASIRDQIAEEISSGVYPAGALLPSIREIMQRWEVSTTTARRVLDQLAANGYARKDSTRGHISTGGASPATQHAPLGETARRPVTSPAPGPARLTVRPSHTIPAGGSIHPDAHTHIAALDVRTEGAPADAALALRLTDPSRPVVVRRLLLAASDGTPVQLRTSYLPVPVAEGTPLAEPEAISEPWPAALASHLGRRVVLVGSTITARHPHQDEATALALPPDAAVLLREDIRHDEHGTPVEYTRTVWSGDTTRLAIPE